MEKAADKKKYDFEDRMEFLQDALEEDENCTTCRHELGVSLFKNAKRTGGSFGAAKGFLSELVERCPDYHSDPYYYLGAMHYADNEYEQALTYFQRYTSFPDDDPEKFCRLRRKYEEVREALPNVEFWRDFYKNDDFEPVRVAGVSSNSDDYLPCLSPDGDHVLHLLRAAPSQGRPVCHHLRRIHLEFPRGHQPELRRRRTAAQTLQHRQQQLRRGHHIGQQPRNDHCRQEPGGGQQAKHRPVCDPLRTGV